MYKKCRRTHQREQFNTNTFLLHISSRISRNCIHFPSDHSAQQHLVSKQNLRFCFRLNLRSTATATAICREQLFPGQENRCLFSSEGGPTAPRSASFCRILNHCTVIGSPASATLQHSIVPLLRSSCPSSFPLLVPPISPRSHIAHRPASLSHDDDEDHSILLGRPPPPARRAGLPPPRGSPRRRLCPIAPAPWIPATTTLSRGSPRRRLCPATTTLSP